MTPPEPDCLRCRHYYVTYETSWPHGCRAFDFKSARLPRMVVAESSGKRCEVFEARPGPGGESPPPTSGRRRN